MIEIKEEVIKLITRCWYKMSHGDIPNDYPPFQKLLQDHEDAKNYKLFIKNYPLLDIFKKLVDAKKDRQIIKKLEELFLTDQYISYEDWLRTKKILEGKNV